MGQQAAVLETRLARAQRAREFFFDQGESPHAYLERALLRSWERCRKAGLEVQSPAVSCEIMEQSALVRSRDQYGNLILHSRSIMEHVYEQIRHSGSVVVLANEEGLLLDTVGDPLFLERASQASLQPGARWDEGVRGTNAVGTALVEKSPVEVVGCEHFLDRISFLTCSAVPLIDPHGIPIGVLDISGDARAYQRHTLGLVRMSASLIEKRLFESEFSGDLLVCFHSRPEYVGSLGEGIAAVGQDGRVLAINPAGLGILGLHRDEVARCHCSTLFQVPYAALVDRARREGQALHTLTLANGSQIYARLRGQPPAPPSAARIELPAEVRNSRGNRPGGVRNGAAILTLDSLATGDAKLQLAIDRAKRVLGRDIPILIQGESGAGKEMFAKAVHSSGLRADGPFVALNCAAIPESLIESELFGYQGGAFTGARKEGAVGKIQQAHGGTLFLDEIGDMPLNLQARLLRVLQERCVTPLGGTRLIPVDISLVCATHRRLKEAVADKTFREDLYYRLNGLSVTLPPLRERTDLRRLVEILICGEGDGRSIRVSDSAFRAFEAYAWPGNIRQLHNVIRVAIALLDDENNLITEAELPQELLEDIGRATAEYAPGAERAEMGCVLRETQPKVSTATEAASLDEIERRVVMQTLEAHGGNISAAARVLGVSRNTLYRKLGRM